MDGNDVLINKQSPYEALLLYLNLHCQHEEGSCWGGHKNDEKMIRE
jgi:hypothetical protein